MDKALLVLFLVVVVVAGLDVVRAWLDHRDVQKALAAEMDRKASAARDLLR